MSLSDNRERAEKLDWTAPTVRQLSVRATATNPGKTVAPLEIPSNQVGPS